MKNSLIKAVSSVRKKFRTLHNMRAGDYIRNCDILKPITGKLDSLIDIQNINKSEKKFLHGVGKTELSLPNDPSNDTNADHISNHDAPKKNGFEFSTLPEDNSTNSPDEYVSKIRSKKRFGINSRPYPTNIKATKKISKKYRKLASNRKIGMTSRLIALMKSGELASPQSEPQNSSSSSHFLDVPILEEGEEEEEEGRKMIIAKSKQPKKTQIADVGVGEIVSISSDDDEVEEEEGEKHLCISRTPTVKTYTTPKRLDKYIPLSSQHAKQSKKKPTLRDYNIEQEKSGTRRRIHESVKDKNQPPRKKKGSGMISNELKRFDMNEHVSYTYWDNANELVDRLRLLIASQSAGNTGHTNEIVSIIEELRESNIIR